MSFPEVHKARDSFLRNLSHQYTLIHFQSLTKHSPHHRLLISIFAHCSRANPKPRICSLQAPSSSSPSSPSSPLPAEPLFPRKLLLPLILKPQLRTIPTVGPALLPFTQPWISNPLPKYNILSPIPRLCFTLFRHSPHSPSPLPVFPVAFANTLPAQSAETAPSIRAAMLGAYGSGIADQLAVSDLELSCSNSTADKCSSTAQSINARPFIHMAAKRFKMMGAF